MAIDRNEMLLECSEYVKDRFESDLKNAKVTKDKLNGIKFKDGEAVPIEISKFVIGSYVYQYRKVSDYGHKNYENKRPHYRISKRADEIAATFDYDSFMSALKLMLPRLDPTENLRIYIPYCRYASNEDMVEFIKMVEGLQNGTVYWRAHNALAAIIVFRGAMMLSNTEAVLELLKKRPLMLSYQDLFNSADWLNDYIFMHDLFDERGYYAINGTLVATKPDIDTVIDESIHTFASFSLRGFAGKEITINNKNAVFAAGAFYNCQNLETVYLPNDAKYQSTCVFEGCPNLKEIFAGPSFMSKKSDYKMLALETFFAHKGRLDDKLSNRIIKIAQNCSRELLEYIIANKNIGMLSAVMEVVTPSINDFDYAISLAEDLAEFKAFLIDCKNKKYAVEDIVENESDNLEKRLGLKSYKPSEIRHLYTISNIDDTHAMIGKYKGDEAEVEIPYMVGNRVIVGIKEKAFKDHNEIKRVVFSEAIEFIGKEAFYGCKSLESVVLSNCIKDVEEYAFCGCKNITDINVPDTIEHIGYDAFAWLGACKQEDGAIYLGQYLTQGIDKDVIVKDGTKLIADKAFSIGYFPELERIVIPGSVEIIGKSAFENCSQLTSVTLSQGLKEIGERAFSSCRSLTKIEIPDMVSVLGDGVFSICDKLTEIVIPDSVEEIGNDCFRVCRQLSSITLPKKLKKIGNEAFAHCETLKIITVPENVTNIGWGAFQECSNLTSISIPDDVVVDFSAFIKCRGLADKNGFHIFKNVLYGYYGEEQDVIVPNGITYIADYAFNPFGGNINSVTLPQGVVEIRRNAFSGCNGMQKLVIPESVEVINDIFGWSGPSRDLQIFGKVGSKAEEYAKQHNINFVAE